MPADKNSPDEPQNANVIPFPSHRRVGAPAQTDAKDPTRDQVSLPGFADEVSIEKNVGRRETVLMAELRGWPAIAERVGAPQAERALSHVIDRALSTLSDSKATDVTLEGDSTQPAVSCIFEDPDSPVVGVNAAVDLRRAVAEAQFPAPPEHQFRIGIGLDSGDVLRVLAKEDVTFESVGPIRMFAAKLRDFAGSGQIFMSAAVYLEARDLIHVQSLGQVRVNAYGDTREAFSLTDLRAGAP